MPRKETFGVHDPSGDVELLSAFDRLLRWLHLGLWGNVVPQNLRGLFHEVQEY